MRCAARRRPPRGVQGSGPVSTRGRPCQRRLPRQLAPGRRSRRWRHHQGDHRLLPRHLQRPVPGLARHAHTVRQAVEYTPPLRIRIGGQFGSTACDTFLDHGQARSRREAGIRSCGLADRGQLVITSNGRVGHWTVAWHPRPAPPPLPPRLRSPPAPRRRRRRSSPGPPRPRLPGHLGKALPRRNRRNHRRHRARLRPLTTPPVTPGPPTRYRHWPFGCCFYRRTGPAARTRRQ